MGIWLCFNIVWVAFSYFFARLGLWVVWLGLPEGPWPEAVAAGPGPGERNFGQKSKIFEFFQKLYFGRKWVVMGIW